MIRLIVALGIASALAACDGTFRTKSFSSTTCGTAVVPIPVIGYTITGIHYGDSRLIVLPVSQIKPNSEFHFRLIPKVRTKSDQHNYQQMQVAITSADDDGDTPANWLHVDGTYNDDNRVLVACIPPTLTKSEYKFMVTVQEVGQLDPRADVIID